MTSVVMGGLHVVEARTSKCAAHGHPEIEVRYSEARVPPVDVDSLLAFFEQSVRAGTRYKPGETLQIGWMFTRLFDRGRGLLGLEEPDFASVPIRWVDCVDRTLLHLRHQRDVAESVGMLDELAPPSIRSSAVVCSRYATSAAFGMRRTEPAEADSGWFVGCLDPDHDHTNPRRLGRVSLYELVLHRPAAMAFLALPPGCAVTVGADGALLMQRIGTELRIGQGSYLDEIARRTGGRFVAPEL